MVTLRLLGSVEVYANGVRIDPGPLRQRMVLAALAVDVGRPVLADAVIDRVWGENPPQRARHALQVYIARIRKVLAAASDRPAPLVHRSGGYLLDLDPDTVDVHLFHTLVAGAGPGQPVQARAEQLRAALDLWRDRPMAELTGEWIERVRGRLEQKRITALASWAAAAVELGAADRVIDELTRVSAEHPLVEPLVAELLRAYMVAGRGAEALRTYATTRALLAEELGAEPGPELRALHQELLSGDGPPAGTRAAPAQLPLGIRGFVERTAELAALDALPATGAVVITGEAGVGKTALAVCWAHRVRDRFPDGQLYLNLRGFHPEAAAMTAGEALPGFLMALGLRAEQIPPTLDAQSGLYRTLLAGRRVLVLLDNARDAEQVRPLLPGAPGCLVVLTSRHALTGLVAGEAAHPMPLDLLGPRESRELLAHRLGAARTAAEPEAVEAIIERCARLPLALAVAAARAAARPRAPLAELAAELGGSVRLDALSTGDAGTDVRAVFSWSYRLLRPAAARLFRLLGLQPGADLAVDAAVRLAGGSRSEVLPLLAELLAAHLVAQPAAGRYAMHDLLRAYAAELAADEEPEPDRRAALHRLSGHYLDTARAAIRVLFPAELRLPAGPSLSGPDAARAWLDAERANLVAAAQHAPELATILYHYLDSGHPADAAVAHTYARQAARDAGDHAAEAAALNHLGILHRRAGRFRQAGDHHRRALTICRRVGDRAGEAQVHIQLGIVVGRLGDYDRSKQHHQEALDLFREIGDRLGEANQLNMFGIGNRLFGDPDAAITFHRQAFDLYRDLGNRFGEANALNGLGAAYHQAGNLREAVDCQRRALVTVREIGHRPGEIGVRNDLGRVLLLLGDHRGALGHHRRALALCREAGEHNFEVETMNALGAALLTAGDPGGARAHFADALTITERTGDRREQAQAHDGLAGTHRAAGDPHKARHHWQAARDIYLELGLPDPCPVMDTAS